MAKGHEGFYKRGNIWWCRTDPVERRPKSTRCTDITAARSWLAIRERIANDPDYTATTEATLGEWIGRTLNMKQKEVATGKCSPSTLRVYEQKLGHFARIWGVDLQLERINPRIVDRYVTQREEEGSSDHTISKEIFHLLYMLKLAKRAGVYRGDTTTLRPPTLNAGYVPRKRSLTRQELVRLLARLEPYRAAFPAICIALGCRSSEAFKLLPSDIDLVAGKVHLKGTKTEESDRWVPILSLYRPLIEAALPYLPLAEWGNHNRDIKVACRQAGIAQCSPNDFRRTHATLLKEAGVDSDVVRRLLGHTTTRLVDLVYGQPTPKALGALAEERLATAEPINSENIAFSPQVLQSTRDDDSFLAKAPVAQRIEQRFPKPQSDSVASANSVFVAARGRSGLPEKAHRSAAGHVQALHSPSVWSLAFAAHFLGVLGGQ